MRLLLLPLLSALFGTAFVHAAESAQEDWQAKWQSTYIWQRKEGFNAPYTGQNSLHPGREKSYSFTATGMLGWRPWQGGELYANPEVAQGVPLSELTGLGGFTNGEMARTSGPHPTLYGARLFLRQTIGMGGERTAIESDQNQMAGMVDSRRLVITAGILSVTDIFDDNAYAHDARSQFLNWALVTHGAYDFAADARGYTRGIAVEYFDGPWAIRFGRFAQPERPNQMTLDNRMLKHFGDQLEIERAHMLFGQAGKLRLLAFHNRTLSSRYDDALQWGQRNAQAPALDAVRTRTQSKFGMGLNLEQSLSNDAGLFARAMWADGKTETYAFTEIDRSLSAGLQIQGNRWGRGQDSIGIAAAINGLSGVHRRYLAAGGLGFFIGDGDGSLPTQRVLNYRSEQILETYYNWQPASHFWITANVQHIRNPAYNADRGPANFFALRLHTEF